MPPGESSAFRAWSFLTRAETESGELYYADDPEFHYVYDDKVANGGKVAVGDLAVLRDSEHVLGAGWIDKIETAQRDKIRYRCPYCSNPSLKQRKTKQPRYYCDKCGNAFDDRVEEPLTVEESTANYAPSFRRAEPPLPVSAIESLYLSRSWMNSIRELDAIRVRPVLQALAGIDVLWWEPGGGIDVQIAGGHGTATTKIRRGQGKFRDELLARFGSSCAFTGPQPTRALQAAHLYLYSADPRHDVRGGLLLRADLHSLFDAWLITIDPDSWFIHVAPELLEYPDLAALEGKPLAIEESQRPRREYIQAHATEARSRWAPTS